MESDVVAVAQTWRSTHGDMSDEEWELIADLVAPYWTPGSIGRPVKVDRRRVVTMSRFLLKFSGGHSVFRLQPDRTLRV